MLRIETPYHGSKAATERLVLNFEQRTKSRLSATLTSGKAATLSLSRGVILRGGDKLEATDGTIVEIVAANEALLEARFTTPLALARAAYHLGNRHVAVEAGREPGENGAYWLRLYPDHVLEHMLEGLGAESRKRDLPFEPEAGAYAHGHHHPEHGATKARIHEMG